MPVTGRAHARRAVARCHIKASARSVRPGIMDIGRQANRATAMELASFDVDIVLGQLRPDAGVERHSFPCGLGRCGLRHNGGPPGNSTSAQSVMPTDASRPDQKAPTPVGLAFRDMCGYPQPLIVTWA